MATFLELANEISSEVSKGGLKLFDTEIKSAINSAIAYYEPKPFRFNQGFGTVTTVADQETYALPADLLVLKRAQILFTPTQLDRLRIMGWEEYQDQREGLNVDRGQCDDCSVYNDELYLYPTPNNVFTVKLWYIKRVANTPLVSSSTSNAWTNRARELIKCRTKYNMYMHRLMNVEWATAYAQMEGNELLSLQSEFIQQSISRELEESF